MIFVIKQNLINSLNYYFQRVTFQVIHYEIQFIILTFSSLLLNQQFIYLYLISVHSDPQFILILFCFIIRVLKNCSWLLQSRCLVLRFIHLLLWIDCLGHRMRFCNFILLYLGCLNIIYVFILLLRSTMIMSWLFGLIIHFFIWVLSFFSIVIRVKLFMNLSLKLV